MRNLKLKSDDDLMLEIKAGNMLAFDALYAKYSIRIYKFAFSILKLREEAENVVQEVFLKLWINRDKLEKASSLRYYVFTIAYHSSISLIRTKLKETKFIDYLLTHQDLSADSVTLEVEYNELETRLRSVIDTLPVRQREVYLLHWAQGLKYSEIAERLGITENTIENHMSRALKKIREKLGDYTLLSLLFCYLFV